MKKAAKKTIKRGKTEINILVESITEADTEIRLNEPAAKQYIENLTRLKDQFDLSGEVSLPLIAGMPDVIKVIPSVEDEDEIKDAIGKALDKALEAHDKMRGVEGEKLVEDLSMRADLVKGYAEKIKERAPQIEKEYADGLRTRIKIWSTGQWMSQKTGSCLKPRYSRTRPASQRNLSE